MSDTIFYDLKLKRTRKPIEVFTKMQKSIKKKGATKNWLCTIDESNESMIVDFGDGESETFSVSFDNKICSGFCKVHFPLEGDMFNDDKKSEFKALLNMIYSARTSFSAMEITDDYGLAESFMDSKINKIVFRDLNSDEIDRAKRLYDEGHTDYKEFIMSLLYDYRNLPYNCDYSKFVNIEVPCTCFEIKDNNTLLPFIESFLYETTEYRDKGVLYEIPEYYFDLNGVWFAVYAFVMGIDHLLQHFFYDHGWDPKFAQVLRLYNNKFLPSFEIAQNDFEKCLLAYRYFVSIFDYLGFKYVGVINMKPVWKTVLDEYGVEKGTIFLTCYCTTVKYILHYTGEKRKKLADCLKKNMIKRYGENTFNEYFLFKQKYQIYRKFRLEIDNFADSEELKYIDKSLIMNV